MRQALQRLSTNSNNILSLPFTLPCSSPPPPLLFTPFLSTLFLTTYLFYLFSPSPSSSTPYLYTPFSSISFSFPLPRSLPTTLHQPTIHQLINQNTTKTSPSARPNSPLPQIYLMMFPDPKSLLSKFLPLYPLFLPIGSLLKYYSVFPKSSFPHFSLPFRFASLSALHVL